jgi:N-dimethylarginine dimethylaminohydrolase
VISQHSTASLGRVYVRPPQSDAVERCDAYGWHAPFDPVRATDEHAAFRAELEAAGAEVVTGTAPVPGNPDAIYTFDPVLVTDRGAIALRPGKEGRRGEPKAMLRDLADLGLPVVGTIKDPATAEGGDMFWLDETTLLVGRGYRTNDAGIAQLRSWLPDTTLHVFDLPHQGGPGRCLHLLSLLSPLADDLVVGFLPLLPVRLVELLRGRGITLVEVPERELETMGPNVLALAPRRALALEGNPETRRRMEAAGVDVQTYRGDQISRKGDGGPTCLTRPLERG